jgi:hypothetical protein
VDTKTWFFWTLIELGEQCQSLVDNFRVWWPLLRLVITLQSLWDVCRVGWTRKQSFMGIIGSQRRWWTLTEIGAL